MSLRPDNRGGRRQQIPEEFHTIRYYVGPVLFLEVILATALVFGLFAAACQPFGWSGVLQFLLCALLGGLLWLVDEKLDGLAKSGTTRGIAKVNPRDGLPQDDVILGAVEKIEAHPMVGVAKSGE